MFLALPHQLTDVFRKNFRKLHDCHCADVHGCTDNSFLETRLEPRPTMWNHHECQNCACTSSDVTKSICHTEHAPSEQTLAPLRCVHTKIPRAVGCPRCLWCTCFVKPNPCRAVWSTTLCLTHAIVTVTSLQCLAVRVEARLTPLQLSQRRVRFLHDDSEMIPEFQQPSTMDKNSPTC